MVIKKILIANRGEIACRIMRTAQRLGIKTVAIFSEPDAQALHVQLADEAVLVGPAKSTESYLNQKKILDIAHQYQVDAIHPGYGFLAENADFARLCAQQHIIFIGPTPENIELMGAKSMAKNYLAAYDIPLIPGYQGAAQDEQSLLAAAQDIGFPVILKASAGGGGKGMRIVEDTAHFSNLLASAQREARASFGDETMIIEKYLSAPRHIEIQIFADNFGHCVHLFERDCSIQRRHQKIIEEAPAPQLSKELRAKISTMAVKIAQIIQYRGAGTIEFLVAGENFYFMEMNTRLQVEHPVTEMITGLDLVEWQLLVAANHPLPLQEVPARGCAIEVRICAEDPARDFLPAIGTIHHLQWPSLTDYIRIDTGIENNTAVLPYYDSLLAKLIVHGADRQQAIMRLQAALSTTKIAGVATNLEFLQTLIQQPDFIKGEVHTHFIAQHKWDTKFIDPWDVHDHFRLIPLPDIFQVQHKTARSDHVAEDHGASMCAPMPGTIVAILKKVGDEVHSGDHLIILEAMKMEHTIRAAIDGRITAIHCQVGEMVQEGIELLELE